MRKRVNGKWIKKSLSASITEARRLRDELLKEIMVYGDIQGPRVENNPGMDLNQGQGDKVIDFEGVQKFNELSRTTETQ